MPVWYQIILCVWTSLHVKYLLKHIAFIQNLTFKKCTHSDCAINYYEFRKIFWERIVRSLKPKKNACVPRSKMIWTLVSFFYFLVNGNLFSHDWLIYKGKGYPIGMWGIWILSAFKVAVQELNCWSLLGPTEYGSRLT